MANESLLAAALAWPLLSLALLLFAVVASVEAGRYFGRYSEDTPGSGAVNGAIFAVLGLLLAFSFSGAAARFDMRRDLVVQEANAIGTARLRVDLLPADAQPPIDAALDRYIDARIAAYRLVNDEPSFRAALGNANAISAQIWALAVAAGKRPDAVPAANILLLPALNAMIDLTTTRAFTNLMHPPPVIRYLLVAMALVSAFLAGLGFAREKRRTIAHELAFAVIMTAIIYVTVDLEYPRLGFIRIDSFEMAVVDFTRTAPVPKATP